MYNWWKSDNPDTIIRIADENDVRYLFNRGVNEIPIGPTENAIFIKDGKLLAVIDQDTIKIADEWKEEEIHTIYWKKERDHEEFKTFFGKILDTKEHDKYNVQHYHNTINKRVMDGNINIVIVASTTLELLYPIGETDEIYPKDYTDTITGKVRIRFRFDTLNLSNVVKLLGRTKSITTWDLRNRLGDEIVAEALRPVMKKYIIEDIYGNRDVREDIENAIMHELKHTFLDWSIELKKVVVNWNPSDYVRKRADLERKRAGLDYDLAIEEMHRTIDNKKRAGTLGELMNKTRFEEEKNKILKEFNVKELASEFHLEMMKRELGKDMVKEEINTQKELGRIQHDGKMEEAKRKYEMEKHEAQHRIEMNELESKNTEIKRGEILLNQQDKIRAVRDSFDVIWNRMAREREEEHRLKIERDKERYDHIKTMKEKDIEGRKVFTNASTEIVESIGKHGGFSDGNTDGASMIEAMIKSQSTVIDSEAGKVIAEAKAADIHKNGDEIRNNNVINACPSCGKMLPRKKINFCIYCRYSFM